MKIADFFNQKNVSRYLGANHEKFTALEVIKGLTDEDEEREEKRILHFQSLGYYIKFSQDFYNSRYFVAF